MYTRSYIKRYNQCLTANNAKFRQQTELLISGFLHNQTDVAVGGEKEVAHTKIFCIMCNMYGDLHMFNESNMLSFCDKLKLQKLISSALYNRNIAFRSTNLIFDAKRDGFTHKAFYEKCANYENTLVIIESDANAEVGNSENDYVSSDSDCNANVCSEPNRILFGAFTTKAWVLNSGHIEDKRAFLFRLSAHKYGPTIFRLEHHAQFALFQPPPPLQTEQTDEDGEDGEDEEVDAIFYFGQPVSLLLSEKCNVNDKSYSCGGEKSNYNIPYRGSILGVMHAPHFKVVNFQVFHIHVVK